MIHNSLFHFHAEFTLSRSCSVNKRKILVEILEIILTLLLLFSFRPVTVSLVVNFGVVVNEVVLLALRIS